MNLVAFGVLLVLFLGVAGVALVGGLWVGAEFTRNAVQERPLVARTTVSPTASTSTGGGTVYHPATEDDVDADAEALDRVRDSDEAELRGSPRGFRGRDLSDREVDAWLERFGL